MGPTHVVQHPYGSKLSTSKEKLDYFVQTIRNNPLVIKHGNGKSPIYRFRWGIFQPAMRNDQKRGPFFTVAIHTIRPGALEALGGPSQGLRPEKEAS